MESLSVAILFAAGGTPSDPTPSGGEGFFSPSVLAIMLSAIFTLAGIIYTARQTTKAKERSIEAEAYQRAQSINQSMVTNLQEEIARQARSYEATIKRLEDDLTSCRRRLGES